MNEDVNISALPVATAIASPDVAPIVQGGVTKQADVSLFGGSLISTNIARIDATGNDATGTVGNLNKPFLTVQAGLDALVAAGLSYGVVDVGANDFLGDITLDDSINIMFTGVPRINSLTKPFAFQNFTLTVAATIGLSNCIGGNIFTSQNLRLEFTKTRVSQVSSTKSGGTLDVICLGNDSETSEINGGNVATLTIVGVRPAGVGSDNIILNQGIINIRNCSQQSGYTGLYDIIQGTGEIAVNATNCLFRDVTCTDATLRDSRASGTLTCTNGVVYDDIMLNPASMNFSTLPQQTDDSGLNPGQAWIDTTAGLNIVKVKL